MIGLAGCATELCNQLTITKACYTDKTLHVTIRNDGETDAQKFKITAESDYNTTMQIEKEIIAGRDEEIALSFSQDVGKFTKAYVYQEGCAERASMSEVVECGNE